MNRGGFFGIFEFISDEYSLEFFSNENFLFFDEDSLSSSSEEYFLVVKDELRFVYIYKLKSYVKFFNYYYIFFKICDWKRLDENRYVEESRVYYRKYFDDDDNINEVIIFLLKVNVE